MSRIVPVILLAAVAGVLSAAQLKVDVGLVNVVATVLDDRNRHVADLTPDDFTLYEDGEVQSIVHFAQSEDLRVSVGILLDTSGSMERKIDTATVAVEQFLGQIHPDDEIFLVTFDNQARIVEDFTDDRRRLARALRSAEVGGGTAIHDALSLGVDHIRNGKHDKKAILLISDGDDTSSATSFERALDKVRESEILVYSLGITPNGELSGPVGPTPPTSPGPIPAGPRRSMGTSFPGGTAPTFPGPPVSTTIRLGIPTIRRDILNMEFLELLGEISGGRAWLVSGFSDDSRRNQISDALDVLANELRNQYSIGYYRSHSLQDGRWHLMAVIASDPVYRVRHREAYFGNPGQE